MTPAAQARAVVEALGESFDEWLAHALEHGYVWSSPTCFIMARSVWDDTCWMIDLAAGDMAEFFRVDPAPKKWVAFRRGDSHSVHPYERIKRRCCHGKLTESTATATPDARTGAHGT